MFAQLERAYDAPHIGSPKRPGGTPLGREGHNVGAPKGRTITDDHKAAISAGRAENAAVAAYLDALARPRRRGRPKRKPAELRADLRAVVKALDEPQTALDRLHLIARREALEEALAGDQAAADPRALAEPGFVEHAARYSQRRGITWAAWREVGVPAPVLKAAGIDRNGRDYDHA